MSDICSSFELESISFSLVFEINVEDKYPRELVLEVYKLAKKLFLNRRKTLLNNLSNVYNKEKAVFILQKLGIPETARIEEISPERILEIYKLTK